jgi:GT2 family glycosyltransferase
MNGSVAQLGEVSSARKVSTSFVVAVVATYNRKKELADLLQLLSRTPGLEAVVVADNAADREVRMLTENSTTPAYYLAMEANRGAGPALNRALAYAREKWNESPTHFWILDDDIRFAPDALEKFLAALRENDAQLVAPLIVDPSGTVLTWPKLKSRAAQQFFFERKDFGASRFADDVDPRHLPELRACMGTCYLMSRICYEQLGAIREDFWLLGEDVEYTARVAQKFRAIFCPQVVIEHFWGSPLVPRSAERSAYFKACAALQNNLFMLLHLPHTRFVFRPFLGSLRRFFQLHLRSREAAADLLRIAWHAAIRGEPAGTAAGRRLRERRQTYEPR